MRLKKIKLAGFKSFVDPISLELKSPLIAIVGPNGCGKSNVIDAVRWVMGESSAKNLRGESATDVIFNGSSTRKPAGQASVELIFDNSDGALGGEYSKFSELSIRRQASRDGQSTYFLNGARCRRRDILEIFFGTGFGSRSSYAIIGQGMISHLIEARPEELRGFLEEAAGISLYKKRRQETENRMRNTRENLERLSDIKQEHEKQLDRLKRQSESAEKFLNYKEEQKILEVQLSTLRWKLLNETGEKYKERIDVITTAINTQLSERTAIDQRLEKTKLSYDEQLKSSNQIQNEYYECSNKISKSEQILHNYRERVQRLMHDLSVEEKLSEEITLQLAADQKRMEQLAEELSVLESDYENSAKLAGESEEIWQKAAESMRLWNQGWESVQEQGNQINRDVEISKARLNYLQGQNQDIQNRIVRLEKEKSDLNADPLTQDLALIQQEIAQEENNLNQGTKELQTILSDLETERQNNQSRTQQLYAAKHELHTLEGRRSSLEMLQKVALGKTNQKILTWLEKYSLSDKKRLGEIIKVEEGYETAVEVVLANMLEALCVESVENLLEPCQTLDDSNIAFFDALSNTNARSHARLDVPLLFSKVATDSSLHSLLANVYVVDSFQQALLLKTQLISGESIITKEGIWVGENWIKIAREKETHYGVLERSQQLETLRKEIALRLDEVDHLEKSVHLGQNLVRELELKQQTLQNTQQNIAKIIRDLSNRENGVQAQLSYVKERHRLISEELLACTQQLENLAKEIKVEELSLENCKNHHHDYSEKRISLENERDNLKTILSTADNQMRSYKDAAHQLALKRQSVKMQYQSIEAGLSRLYHQLKGLSERHITLKDELEKTEKLQVEVLAELNQLLSKQSDIELNLTHDRSVVETLLEEVRNLEKIRSNLEQALEEEQNSLNTLRLEWQSIEVRCQMGLDTIIKAGFQLEEQLEILPKEIDESEWVHKIEKLENRIQRLGAINLAAIEEFQAESERKLYLDAQYQDLTEALTTLESAIRKIDKETRTQFKETFEKVNTEFCQLFPRLFGGGEAHLELTDDNLLEAGVTVVARPPGKRNNSIHQLSGGEKALVAVSLVFAIFRLNPAPFCLLDEVDAPLDDANVMRFCNLVKHMAESVQFIYITHNKLAMEMAHHLIGVTMKEAGVSRLVAVDVDAAVTLVAN